MKTITFQEIILRLQAFWASRGCLLWQPYSEKVGAGTMNPATVLGVLGPRAWNVAYVEPSYRPDDGRYGENPNRMQMHFQYQVILKPDPGNPQELYLQSLEALGIGIDRHDIRFVEDNWESPALGAWGLGWEVWLDGLEITQFTYFQQAAGQVLPVPAVEITYGLERIAMFLQRVRSVWELDWDGSRTYKDVLLRPEIDHCRYDFEVANIERLQAMYQLFEDEARACLQAGVAIPAFDLVLRCSHTFNVLDARGAIGVTERASYFARMRDLTRQVADLYLKQREQDGGPAVEATPTAAESRAIPAPLEQPADFVLEVGTEELPARDVQAAVAQWSEAVPTLLEQLRLSHQGVKVTASPRRLCVSISGLAPRQTDLVTQVKGPAADRAFDAEGKPTAAGLGFARAQGVAVEDLCIIDEGKRRQVVANKMESGAETGQVLADALPELIAGLRFAKTMRWNETGVSFSRPIRWLLALHGDRVIPFRYAVLVSDRQTVAPRPLASTVHRVERAEDYPQLMRGCHALDRNERRRQIVEQVNALAGEVGGSVPKDDELTDEVTDLVEWPAAVRGRFEEKHLALPRDVLIMVMKSHQRYFPVTDPNTGALKPYFVAVANGRREDLGVIRQGYEDVLRARYADAAFFLQQDLEQPLREFVPRLATLTFQERLGSMLDKQRRIESLVAKVAAAMGLDAREAEVARRAAGLCKADLATALVIEMTSLQGVMGREYALRSGEPEAVAQAIYEHYLPRFAGDALPQSRPALALGIADRLDTLVGLFAAGLKPTGSADPYGLRRTAGGLVQLLVEEEARFNLREALALAGQSQPLPVSGEVLADLGTFITERLRGLLRERGLPADVVEAALASRDSDPYGALLSATALAQAAQEADWPQLLPAYARCKRLVKDLPHLLNIAPERYTEPATAGLYAAWEKTSQRLGSRPEMPAVLSTLRELREPITRFFVDVLVMVPETDLREARLALIQRIAALPDGVADMSRLQGF
jgi:glycyl-tRNA synthetase